VTTRLDPIPWQQPAVKRQRMAHNPRIRAAQVKGDPFESARLRPYFLRWIGNRTQAAGLKVAGIDYCHGCAWLAEKTVLRDVYQPLVRRLLDEADLLPSPAS
jgi:hypothetical protein